jgi:hypothetical protein
MNNLWLDANWSDRGLAEMQRRRPDIKVDLGTG